MRLVYQFVALFLLRSALAAQTSDSRALERDILEQLVEINTSDSARQTNLATKAMATRLVDAGLPTADVRLIETTPGVTNLVARYRGRGAGAKPILLMAHLDVVDARREDWSFDPFVFRESGGYYYGRGSSDNKAGAAMLVAAFIRYKQEGFVPARDLVMVLTGDEETTGEGIQTLLERHRNLVDADFALNTDAGGGEIRDGKPIAFSVQTAEKVYLTFQLEVRNKGGHSSVPEADNAIYRLSNGLSRLARFTFPVRLNETTRATFAQSAATQPRELAAAMRALARNGDPAAARRLSAAAPYYNAQLRTTCVATRLFAGHADNALPQLARATVNCRLLPDHPPDSAEGVLNRVLADTAIHVSRVRRPTLSPPSPLRSDVMSPVETLVCRMWPGVVVVPEMSTGATDGLYVRNAGIPVYGVSAVFERIDDIRAHGRDERIGVKAYHDAASFWYELMKTLGGTQARRQESSYR
jgi:acetylornithine deacetylase/succinyl-diaminopimelate desuccinylase-like protein